MDEQHKTNIDEIIEKATFAAAIFNQYDQEQTDRIVRAVYKAGLNNRVRLAKMAAEESQMGNWKDKVVKNAIAAQFVYENIKHQKTVGIISDDERSGIIEIAQPIGPILAVIPVTNPTSTIIFKILIALKTRNPVIISPHRRATKSSIEAARICYEAALSEDAPEECIQWTTHKTREETQYLMQHPKLALILATGGTGLVHEAYSSGTPALGVGAGNVPVYIEETADIPYAVEQVILSKTFDNGTICASEQALVVEKKISTKVKKELVRQRAYFLNPEEHKAVEKVAYFTGTKSMSAEIVGQSVEKIGQMAGIDVPEGIRLLIVPLKKVGYDEPLSSEILAPILAFFETDDFEDSVRTCIDLNFHGGIGHSASIFSYDEEKIRKFSVMMNAGRILVNMPSSQGAVGSLYNTLEPSFTLGCGTYGKNITTDNVSAHHLLNIQRITKRRMNERMLQMGFDIYMDESIDADTLEQAYNKNY
ncbi:MAG: aldehyde dehydrogenase family protein [Bacteroidales bacterium]|nr:aldehyde dehydrogenase family protein [Bacteroidota bacterium]MBL6949054.1 aldehyde dehydrogenase family protein [Bacteroidales bacterium]